MLVKILFNLIQVFLFSYLFWRRTKEDYKRQDVLSASFYILIGNYLGFIISKITKPDYWFWSSFAISLLGLFWAVRKFDFKIYEALDAYVLSNLSFFTVVLLYNWIAQTHIYSGFSFAISLFLFLTFFLIDKHYKGFSWYESGRVGFSGLSVSGFFFLMRGIIAIFVSDVISFVGSIDIYLSLTLAFLSFLTIFCLSRSQV